jgi:hypothetical protein
MNTKSKSGGWLAALVVAASLASANTVWGGWWQYCVPIGDTNTSTCGSVPSGCPGTCTVVTTSPATAGNCGGWAVWYCPVIVGSPLTGTMTKKTNACGVTGTYSLKCDCSGITISSTPGAISYNCI